MNTSFPKILRSPKGYYVGRTTFDMQTQTDIPYCRMSDYFRNIRQAEDELIFIFTTLSIEELEDLNEHFLDYMNIL